MRLKRYLFVLIFSAITFLLIGCGSKAAIGSTTPVEPRQPVDNEEIFTISSDKQLYSLNEEIFITLSLKNNSDEPVTVNNLLLSDNLPIRPYGVVGFKIYGPTGDKLTFRYIQDYLPPPSEYFVLLPSNESTSKRNAVTKDYDFDQIGIYTISAEYSNLLDSPDGRTAWKGTLVSNTITIEVVP